MKGALPFVVDVLPPKYTPVMCAVDTYHIKFQHFDFVLPHVHAQLILTIYNSNTLTVLPHVHAFKQIRIYFSKP